MPRYRLKASVNWIAGSETDLGDGDYESEDAAAQAAWEAAAELIDAYAELIEDTEK